MAVPVELSLRIILEDPPPGVDFGLQKGGGNDFVTVQRQKSSTRNLEFNCQVVLKKNKHLKLDFFGPFVHGPADGRFLYIDIGTYAGVKDSPWRRRLKIPLEGIPVKTLEEHFEAGSGMLEARVPGKGKDGTPNCGTVKDFKGWK